MSRLLIITHEHIGPKMAGPSIRAWELGQALANSGLDVILASPHLHLDSSGKVKLVKFSWDDTNTVLGLIGDSDVVLAAGPVISRIVHLTRQPISRPVVVDLYDVSEIERIIALTYSDAYSDYTVDFLVEEMLIYLRQGDFFICGSQKQLDFWLGALLLAGRLDAEILQGPVDALITVVPMGISNDPPFWQRPVVKGVIPGIGTTDRVILWLGGIWEWTDPITLVSALEDVLQKRRDVRLVFGALYHYDEHLVPRTKKAARFLETCRKLDWLNRYVFFLDWIPYFERGSYLIEADVGVSLHDYPFESRYAIRARTLDYLWASLPCVVTEGDELAAALATCGLAQVVPPKDSTAVSEALLKALNFGISRDELSQRTAPLRESLYWSSVIQPLLPFLARPYISQTRERLTGSIGSLVRLRQQIEYLLHANQALKVQIESFQRGRIMRLLRLLDQILRRRRK
jgi:glycosyltransferase involved in cell wall biosynthesis